MAGVLALLDLAGSIGVVGGRLASLVGWWWWLVVTAGSIVFDEPKKTRYVMYV